MQVKKWKEQAMGRCSPSMVLRSSYGPTGADGLKVLINFMEVVAGDEFDVMYIEGPVCGQVVVEAIYEDDK